MTNADSLTKIVEDEVSRFKEQVKLVESGYLNKHSLVFSENLLVYIMQKMNPTIPDTDAKEKAKLLLDYFGSNNYVADNRLNKDSLKHRVRRAFAKLEDLGLLKTEKIEDSFYIFTKKGEMYQKVWRLFYWIWNFDEIINTVKDRPEEVENSSIYNQLPNDMWARGKT